MRLGGGRGGGGQRKCALDGCSRPVFVDALTGVVHDFCGLTHAEAAGALRHQISSSPAGRKRGRQDDIIVIQPDDADAEDAAFQLQLAEVQAESKRQAERDEEVSTSRELRVSIRTHAHPPTLSLSRARALSLSRALSHKFLTGALPPPQTLRDSNSPLLHPL
jgi:hypothetical protein